MKPSELAERLGGDEPKLPVIKAFIKANYFPEKEFFNKVYPFIKSVLFGITKFWVLAWFFTTKVLPSQGMEKTTIFLMLLIIVILFNLSRKIE